MSDGKNELHHHGNESHVQSHFECALFDGHTLPFPKAEIEPCVFGYVKAAKTPHRYGPDFLANANPYWVCV